MYSAQKRLESLREHFKTHCKIKEQRQHSSKVHTVRWNCLGTKIHCLIKFKRFIIIKKQISLFKINKFEGNRLASGSNDKTVS